MLAVVRRDPASEREPVDDGRSQVRLQCSLCGAVRDSSEVGRVTEVEPAGPVVVRWFCIPAGCFDHYRQGVEELVALRVE